MLRWPTQAVLPANIMVMDADNLTVRDKIQMAENLIGRALLNRAATTMYAVSDSGVMVMPVGSLGRARRTRCRR